MTQSRGTDRPERHPILASVLEKNIETAQLERVIPVIPGDPPLVEEASSPTT